MPADNRQARNSQDRRRSHRRPAPRNNPLLMAAVWASSLVAAVVVAWMLLGSGWFRALQSTVHGPESEAVLGKAGSRGGISANPSTKKNSWPAPPNAKAYERHKKSKSKLKSEGKPETQPRLDSLTTQDSTSVDDFRTPAPVETRDTREIPSLLTDPQTDSEKVRQPIWLAISQREYDLARELYAEAKSDPDRAVWLTVSDDIENHLKEVEHFWKSVKLGLAKASDGTRLNIGGLPVEVVGMTDNSITLKQTGSTTTKLSTTTQQMPTRLAVALFVLNHPTAGTGATVPFKRYDFPSNGKLQRLLAELRSSPPELKSPKVVDNQIPPSPSESGASNPPVSTPARPASDERHSVPSSEEQKNKLAEIKSLLKKQYSNRSNAGKIALATELLKLATETTDDRTAQYVCLTEAIDIAANAGAAATALDGAETLANRFKISSAEVFPDAINILARNIKSKESAAALTHRVDSVVQQLSDEHHFDAAETIAKRMALIARKSGDRFNYERFDRQADQHKELGREYLKIQPLLEKLKTAPNDPVANQTVGEFYAFSLGDFKKGHLFLIKGSNPQLKKLAKLELRGALTTKQILEVADGWWELSEQLDGLQQQNVVNRASTLYRQVLPDLNGLDKVAVQKQLKQAAKIQYESASGMARLLERRIAISWQEVGKSRIFVSHLILHTDGSFHRHYYGENDSNQPDPSKDVRGHWNLSEHGVTAIPTNRKNQVEYYRLAGSVVSGLMVMEGKTKFQGEGQPVQ